MEWQYLWCAESINDGCDCFLSPPCIHRTNLCDQKTSIALQTKKESRCARQEDWESEKNTLDYEIDMMTSLWMKHSIRPQSNEPIKKNETSNKTKVLSAINIDYWAVRRVLCTEQFQPVQPVQFR